MSSENAWIKPFFTGVMATIATTHILSKLRNNGVKSTSRERQSKSNSIQKVNSTRTKGSTIMDSPTLDNRILRKAETALQLRTSRLIIVVERCTNDHNYSAILRTAEALGIQHVYIIDPQARKSTLKINGDEDVKTVEGAEDDESKVHVAASVELYRSTGQRVKRSSATEIQDRANHHLFAQRALEWLQVTEFDSTKKCIDTLRKDGYDIWSTDLSQEAVTLDNVGLVDEETMARGNVIPEKLAIVFGTEAVGCSSEMLNSSDKRVYLPLRGFADSLNLSVATALVVHQIFILDPTIVGAMSEEERTNLRREWYTKLATQRILIKKDKKNRARLTGLIRKYEELETKQVNSDGNPLHKEQLEKLEQLPGLKAELKQLEEDLRRKASSAIEDLVLNPPSPISDMRRCDEHRTTYAGKNTKKNAGEAWADMPATRYFRIEADTSSFFRDRVKDSADEK